MKSDGRRINTTFFKPGEDRILKVTGSVLTPLFLSMEDLRALEVKEMVDISIQSGTGDLQGHIRISRGVLLENVIRLAEERKEEAVNSKSADDGHKAIISWQEICSTSAGSGVMIVVEKDDSSTDTTHDMLRLISTQDYLTDSRYVQGLRNIEVVLAR